MTDKDFEFITDKIGIWFANLKLKSFRHTFDGDTYPSSALVTDYELFVAKLKKDIEFIPEEPVSDFEMALTEMIDKAQKCVVEPWVVAAQWKDELIKLAKSEEPVSKDLDEAAREDAKIERSDDSEVGYDLNRYGGFVAGAKWQIAKLMKDAIDVTVHIDAGGYPYISQIELYDYDKDIPLAKEGDKYKVVLIKEE